MKEKKWINGNKMLFESEHKEFNHQTKCISTGNCMGDTQLSGYIRPYSETKCNGIVNKKGHLQDYDLNWLNKHLPEGWKNSIRKNQLHKSVIGYSFFYYKRGNKVFIGWIVTDDEHHTLMKRYARNTIQTQSALDECEKYITNNGG